MLINYAHTGIIETCLSLIFIFCQVFLFDSIVISLEQIKALKISRISKL